jgi:hypothetical protein
MTPLRDDPARAWLSTGERMWIDFLGWLLWFVFGLSMFVLRRLVRIIVFAHLPLFSGRISFAIVGGLVALVAPGMRRSILRVKTGRIERLLAQSADSVAADDWTALAAEPAGTIVSVVGWIRGRQYIDTPIGGETAVGVALPCQHTFPGVFESLHDFDLVDESGQAIFVQVTEARIFGTPQVPLDSQQLRHLYGEIGVPNGANPSGWHVHCLRNGDPVMVVGAKQEFNDPLEASFREPALRPALASVPPRPLLIFSIPAERRAG